jgi:AraC-like DNA-binding protein
MKLTYQNKTMGGVLLLTSNDPAFDRAFFTRDRAQKYLTVAWNRGATQKVIVDEIEYDFPANSILPLMVNQSFRFARAADIVAWQFNREFYCIVDFDKEVSCVGFLFYGTTNTMFVRLGETETRKLNLLLEVFQDEFASADNIQGDMLRMLLVRLIIIITRLAKAQHFAPEQIDANKFDLVRQYNLLVEQHYRNEHEVRFYAAQLNKSPKTLANYFALYSQKTPLQIIQERVALEAKRLLYYTDKTSKEIAYDLGFDDAAHFSRFFKKQTAQSPSDFKKSFQFRA